MNERKKVRTNNFRIENNVISFNDTLLQISNISQVSCGMAPKEKISIWSIVMIIIGGFFVSLDDEGGIYTMGKILITVSIIYIILIIAHNLANDEKYLHIYLSSGSVYCILCRDLRFLKEAMDVIEYCINNHFVQEIKIDFDNCQLYNSPIIVGNENEVS